LAFLQSMERESKSQKCTQCAATWAYLLRRVSKNVPPL